MTGGGGAYFPWGAQGGWDGEPGYGKRSSQRNSLGQELRWEKTLGGFRTPNHQNGGETGQGGETKRGD